VRKALNDQNELLKEFQNGVLTLLMNRPDRLNALTPSLIGSLITEVTNANRDPAVKVLVLAGTGRGFCAGGDIGDMTGSDTPQGGHEQQVQYLRQGMELSRLLHESTKPTIARLHGAVAGAGMSLALACDLRIASNNIKLTSAFAKVGLSGDFGGSYFLNQLVGPAKSKEIYFFPSIISAAEAERLGLVNKVVEPANLDAETLLMAETLAMGPEIALRYIKQNFNLASSGATCNQVLDMEARNHIRCTETLDHKEAVQAFIEKRTPVYTGS
jgi:2-(1,2-epoxy-1,2-dihydrophenyl)acetyl-CoA isomerase